MFEWKNFEVHKNIFSQSGSDLYRTDQGQHHVKIRPRDLIRWVELLKDDLHYLTLVEIASVDRFSTEEGHKYQFELAYVLFNMGSHQRINLFVEFNAGEVIPSISDYFVHADWMQREQAEMLGICFEPGPAPLLFPAGAEFYPLRKNGKYQGWASENPMPIPELPKNPNKSEDSYPQESWVWKRFSPMKEETRGLFEWLVCFDPVRVVDSQSRIGFHHLGWERILQNKSWNQILQLVDLINPGAAPTYAVAWAKNLEEVLRIKLPERAQAIRIVMLELARIADHLTVLHEIAWSLNKNEHLLFIDAREKIFELFEKYNGQRLAKNLVCLGGVREDLPHGWINEYQVVAEILKKNLRLIHNSLLGQRDFRMMLDHSGVNAQIVLHWGVGGPAMRASGLNFDLRKSQPFYFYQDIDFDVPVGINGTSYDRYLIRYEEIHQSLRIINQVLDNLPLGEVKNPAFASSHLELNKSLGLPASWHYASLEGPNGEAGFYHLSSERSNPVRLKIKSPSFTIVQALPEFIKGLKENQLGSALASLGIRRTELDR